MDEHLEEEDGAAQGVFLSTSFWALELLRLEELVLGKMVSSWRWAGVANKRGQGKARQG